VADILPPATKKPPWGGFFIDTPTDRCVRQQREITSSLLQLVRQLSVLLQQERQPLVLLQLELQP